MKLTNCLFVLLVLFLCVCAVKCGDISFISSFDDYKLACSLKSKNNTEDTLSSGNLVGLYKENEFGPFRLAMMDLESNNITYLGNNIFNSYTLGGVAIDPINHRLFMTIIPSDIPTLRTYSLLTGELLYQVYTSDISNLIFEPSLGELFALGYNSSKAVIKYINWKTGADAIVATTPLKGITNMVRNINPTTSTMYIYGFDDFYSNIMIAINLKNGSWKYFNPDSITSYVALFSNSYLGLSNVVSIAQYQGQLAPVSIDAYENVTVLSSTRFNSFVLSDKAYDLKENLIIGSMEDVNKIVILNMTSGLIVKQIELNSGASFGPVSFQQICVCCIASQNRAVYGSTLDKSIVLPCQTNTETSHVKPGQTLVSSSNSMVNISVVFKSVVGLLLIYLF